MVEQHSHEELRSLRLAIRAGNIRGHTAGLAPSYVQGNLIILPAAFAEDFLAYCRANAQACPVLAVSEPGSPYVPELGEEIDVRTDLPRYRVFKNGQVVEEPTEITTAWRADFVSLVIGCSFTFDAALIQHGIPLRHVTEGRNVAMYRTNIPTTSAGPFHGPLVVSMRPLTAVDTIRAIEVSGRFADMHGAPIYFGDPKRIGIENLQAPDYGEPVPVLENEYPVFWMCGVTTQAAIEQAGLPICITHAPGCMLITDCKI